MSLENAQNAVINTLNFRSYYLQLITKGKTLDVIKHLLQQLPDFQPQLETLQAHFHSIKRQMNMGTITREGYNVEINKINTALLAFLNQLSKDSSGLNAAQLAAAHLVIGNEANSVLDEVIDNQLEFSENAIRENKIFRTAVGVLFLVAVLFSVIVALRHFDFLQEDLKVIGLLAANILLYIGIGILALFALSLIIKGSLYNQVFLNFSKKTLKR
jgi:hypothetical protein